jgi:hypothetical protein
MPAHVVCQSKTLAAGVVSGHELIFRARWMHAARFFVFLIDWQLASATARLCATCALWRHAVRALP